MRVALVVAIAVGVAGSARAEATYGLQKSKLGLIEPASYHRAAPVPLPPSPLAPVKAVTQGSLMLVGLGLTLGGLVLGGAGFAVLYLCREGTSCYSQTDNTVRIVGWVLAAPGIIPLVVGVAILYFGSGGRGQASLTPKEEAGQWAFSFMPLQGGGLLGGTVRF